MPSTRQQRRADARASEKLERLSSKNDERGRRRANVKRFYEESKELSFKQQLLALAKFVLHVLGWQYYAFRDMAERRSIKKSRKK
jgi:hypothetical protein